MTFSQSEMSSLTRGGGGGKIFVTIDEGGGGGGELNFSLLLMGDG